MTCSQQRQREKKKDQNTKYSFGRWWRIISGFMSGIHRDTECAYKETIAHEKLFSKSPREKFFKSMFQTREPGEESCVLFGYPG